MYRTKRNHKRGGQATKKNVPTLFSTLGNAIKQSASYAAEKGARFMGYERINQQEQKKSQENQEPNPLFQQANNLGQQATQLVSGAIKKADQVGAVLVEALNQNIKNSGVKETFSEAVGNTVGIVKDIVSSANEKLNDPELVEEAKKMVQKASNDASIILEASEPAIDKVVDQTSEIAATMGTRLGDSAVNIALNTAEAVPGAGAFIGFVRDVDSVAKATEAVVDATAKTATSIVEGLQESEKALQEKIKATKDIQSRTTQHMNQFHQVDKFLNNKGLKSGGGLRRPSKKFKRMRRKLTRKLRFKSPSSPDF